MLGDDGPFVRRIPGFAVRPAQLEMARRIEETITHRGTLIAESGTGTGKTFAYLVPALLSGKRTLVSTGTRHLQDQLVRRDLKQVREALALPVRATVLKGRANYLCLERYEHRAALLPGDLRALRRDLARVERWRHTTRTGDIGEADVPEDSPVWPALTSTVDNCLGAKCAHFDACFVNRARREAAQADVLVVNHHLFCADLALKEDGFGQLLPGFEVFIFDEAHQLPQVASNQLGTTVSGRQLADLARDVRAAELAEKSGAAGLDRAAHGVELAAATLRETLGQGEARLDWAQAQQRPAFVTASAGVTTALDALAEALKPAAPAGERLARAHQRALELAERWTRLCDARDGSWVRWLELTSKSFTVNQSPLDTGAVLRGHLGGAGKAWIFTSATLAVGGAFDHFAARIGVGEVDTAIWDSPFDFRRQTLLYLPPDMPDPLAPDYTARVVGTALPVLAASAGRAFLLFTSHRALKEAYRLMAETAGYTWLVQGSAPRHELLERFRREPRAVLLGTASFWEGVDVRGPALSCVIIDKLPFAAPDDPLLRARLKAAEEAGGNPFMELQVPAAVLALKQGAGRLIRDAHDRGVLVICDPRLTTRGYGRRFLDSLPPMPRTRRLADVESFFAAGNP